jgi:hypothetical protein
MSDEEILLSLLKRRGLKPITFTDPQYIFREAIEAGTVRVHSIKDCDFNFNKRGKLVGLNNSSSNSYTESSK